MKDEKKRQYITSLGYAVSFNIGSIVQLLISNCYIKLNTSYKRMISNVYLLITNSQSFIYQLNTPIYSKQGA